MTDTSWYLACIQEIGAFLDSYAEGDVTKRVVRIDSDLIAALLGIMQAAPIHGAVLHHLALAAEAGELLG